MENKEYYGLGISENEVWKTLNNGKTWTIVTEGSYNSLSKDSSNSGRVVLTSGENRGLSFTDDGGNTINQSELDTGNWANLSTTDKNGNMFANSSEGSKIIKSNNGDNWKSFSSGSDEKIYRTEKDSNGNITFVSYPLNIKINNDQTNTIDYKSNSLGVNLDDLINQEHGLLLFILNKMVAPKMSMQLTGKPFDNDSKPYSTLKKISDTFYVNKNNYKNADTLLDFEEDVGMRPLFRTIDDAISEEDNVIIQESYGEDTEIMKLTISKVRTFLNKRKESLLEVVKQKIANTVIDNSNLLSVKGVTKQDIADAISMENMFEGVVKGSAATIYSAIYDRIFSLPDYKIRELIFAGIYEELNHISGKVNYKIEKLISKYKSGADISNELKNIKIEYHFKDGIEIALKKYFDMLSSKIKEMTDTEDDNLKSIAVSKYKENRFNYISQAEKFVNEITIDYDYIDHLSLVKENIKNIQDENGYADKVIEIFNRDIKYFSKDEIEECIELIYSKMIEQLNNIKLNFNLLSEDMNLPNKDFNMTIKYLNSIHNELELRCSQLLSFVYDNYFFEEIDLNILTKETNKDLSDLKNKYINLAKNMTDKDLKEYFESNSINYDDIKLKLSKKISDTLKKLWKENKEVL